MIFLNQNGDRFDNQPPPIAQQSSIESFISTNQMGYRICWQFKILGG